MRENWLIIRYTALYILLCYGSANYLFDHIFLSKSQKENLRIRSQREKKVLGLDSFNHSSNCTLFKV